MQSFYEWKCSLAFGRFYIKVWHQLCVHSSVQRLCWPVHVKLTIFFFFPKVVLSCRGLMFWVLACCRWGHCMAYLNAIVALLAQSVSPSVKVANPGSSKMTPDHHAFPSIFDSWCHTEEASFSLLNVVQIYCDERFQIWFISLKHILPVFNNWLRCFMTQASRFPFWCLSAETLLYYCISTCQLSYLRIPMF